MPDDMQSTGPSRRNRWTKLALVASLALNLLVAGVIAGTAWRHGAGGPGHGRGGPDGAGARGFAFVQALPKDARDALREEFREARSGEDARRSERRTLEQDILGALRADALDAELLTTLMARQAELGDQMQAQAQAAWLTQVMAMNPQVRREYADRVDDLLKRGWRGKRD